MANKNGAESTFTLCYDAETLRGIEQTIDTAFKNGFEYVALPLVDPHDDDGKIIECTTYNEDILQNIPFIYSGDISSQVFSCVFGKISPWITFHQSNSRVPLKSSKLKDINNNNKDPNSSITEIFSHSAESLANEDVIAKDSVNNNKIKKIKNDESLDSIKNDNFYEFAAQEACVGASNELLLQHQLNWASHLGITNLLLPQPRIRIKHNNKDVSLLSVQSKSASQSQSQFASNSQIYQNNNNVNIILNNNDDSKDNNANSVNNNELSVFAPVKYASAIVAAFKDRQFTLGIIPIPGNEQGWKCWKLLSNLISNIKTIVPAIMIGNDLPSRSIQDQWFADGIQHFIIHCESFLTNNKGYPVLSRAHQSLLRRHMRVLNTTIMLRGEPENCEFYASYLNHVRSTVRVLSESESFAKSYWDVLQTPLQPLSDNLDYGTYETFETDPIKYVRYEEAIVKSLQDWNKKLQLSSKLKEPFASVMEINDVNSNNNNNGEITTHTVISPRQDPAEIILMVLGAGRGPLVDCALNASHKTKIPIKIYAIEKNPHAVVILKSKQKYFWHDRVTVIYQDMRDWQPNEKAHIIVSELLGSFGDNELSPECLDGAQKVLRNDGICIPQSYTSYIAPITYYSTWRRLKEMPKDYETPYVVDLVNYSLLDNNKKCWKFIHPNWDLSNDKKINKINKINKNNTHNARYVEIEFKSNKDSVCHGFAGYFQTILYKDVILSIRPQNYSKGMFSWFPIYFPLKEPILVNKGTKLVAHIWRKVDSKRIWYEWCVTEPHCTAIHNLNHRSFSVELS